MCIRDRQEGSYERFKKNELLIDVRKVP
jgi:hypothetical protein